MSGEPKQSSWSFSPSEEPTLLPPAASEAITIPPAGNGQGPAAASEVDARAETAEEVNQTSATLAVPAIPGFELLSELGRGGMGVVYKARQEKLKRLVALKMILVGGHAAESERQRFRTEAEAIARLQHPNIVQIHEIGEHDGLPYFALEYCNRGSLANALDGTPWTATRAAELVQILAYAIHSAHQRGIVHRDLKPANVLLSDDGVPKITDFGLAKKLDEAGMTESGAVMGTSSYMAPEQAGAKGHAIGPATDVYALGAILYELLTGRPPFKAATPLDTVLQVVSEEPVPPRQLQSSTPRDLETICLKCLHKEPAHRYASADALAADLKRFRNHEPIRARPAGAALRLRKWARRRPALATLVLVSILALLLLVGGGALFTMRLHREIRETDRQLARAEWLVYAGQVNLALREYQSNDVRRARELLAATRPALRGWEHGYVRRLCDGIAEQLTGHTDFVRAVAFRPDGRQLASGSVDQTIRLWDVTTRQLVRTLIGHTRRVTGVTYSPDGKQLASTGQDNMVFVWDSVSGKKLQTFAGAHRAVFLPDGKHLAVPAPDGTAISIRQVDTGAETLRLRPPEKQVLTVSCSPDGKMLAAAGSAGRDSGWARIWDAVTGKELLALSGPLPVVTTLAFSPDSGRLAVAGKGDIIRVFGTRDGKEIMTVRGHTSDVDEIAYDPKGDRLVSCSMDDTVRVWDTRTGTEINSFRGHRAYCLAVSPDRRLVASGSGEIGKSGSVMLWNLTNKPEATTFRFPWIVNALALGSDGKLLAAGGGAGGESPGTVQIIELASGKQPVAPAGHTAGRSKNVSAVAFSPDDTKLASASYDSTIKLWEVATGKELLTLRGHGRAVTSVAFSRDGGKIASGSFDRTVRVWDCATGQSTQTLEAGETLFAVAFGLDGKLIVAGGGGDRWNELGSVWVWDASSGRLLHRLRGHTGPVRGVAISPDGALLASASWDKTLKLWHTESGRELATLHGHPDLVSAVAFTPDGRRLLSGSSDGTLRLWDAQTGQEAMSFRLPRQGAASVAAPPAVQSVACSADGRRIAGGARANELKEMGLIQVWEAAHSGR